MSSSFRPECSLDTAFVPIGWLETVDLSPDVFKHAEELMLAFFGKRKYSIEFNRINPKVTSTYPLAASPPLKLEKLLRWARKDPHAVIVLESATDSKIHPVMTLLDFVRVLVYAGEKMVNLWIYLPLESFKLPWKPTGSPDVYAEVRSTYIMTLFSNLMIGDKVSHFAPEVKNFWNVLRQPERLPFFKEVFSSQMRGVHSPAPVEPDQGLFVTILPDVSDSFLVDDALAKLFLVMADKKMDERVLVVKREKNMFGADPAEVFAGWDYVYLDTSNTEFSTELLLLNLKAKYPSITASGCKTPNFEEAFTDFHAQRVYLREALLAAKDLHDQLIH